MRGTIKKNKSEKQSRKPAYSARDYPAVIGWSDEDACFVARVPLLDGCMSHGSSMEEAAHNILDAAEGWLDIAAKHRDFIPPPPKDVSGKLVVRMPKELHANITEIAARNGVSINTWIVTELSRAEGAER